MSGGTPTNQQTFALSDLELASRPTCLAADLLSGRVVLISGGGSGIGRATAWLAARLGARVVICGRNIDKLRRTSEAMVRRGLECEIATLDIRERASVETLFETVCGRHGRVDLLINSAGGQFPQAAIDFSEKGWRAVIDTNLTGTFNMMHCDDRGLAPGAAPGCAHVRGARGSGRIQ
jgi:citronellol/citronellal dehydrogenase